MAHAPVIPALLALLVACGGADTPPSGDAPAADEGASPPLPVAGAVRELAPPTEARLLVPHEERSAAGVTYLDLWTGGAKPGDPVPTVVALPGRGGSPERHAFVYQLAPYQLHVLVPQAPHDLGDDAYAWLTLPPNKPDKVLVPALTEAADALWPWVDAVTAAPEGAERPPTYLIGWSQGGMVGATLALSHPTAFDAVVLAGGHLPAPLTQAATGPLPPFTLVHGREDPVVPYASAAATHHRLPGSTLVALDTADHQWLGPVVTAALDAVNAPAGTPVSIEVQGAPVRPKVTDVPGPDGPPSGTPAPPSGTPGEDAPFQAFTPAP